MYFGGAANLSHSDTEIIKAFGVWLKRAREEHEKRRCALMHRSLSRIMESGIQPPSLVRHRRKGRGGYRDKLHWLGALRVVRYYPPSQLVDYPDSNLKVDAPYSHLPDLHDAAKKAQSLLDEILRCDTSMLS